jgi:vitamin B12/bleomycin/antimicrobial peptide transport system ATP-binding/permease protein
MDRSKQNSVRDAWRLAKPYWVSEEKWSAWGLLLAVIALNLGNVYISVRINEWNNAFYNALQKLDGAEFFRQLGIFCILAFAFIIMAVYAQYLSQMLQIRWRRWLTRRYLGAWLADRSYYHLELKSATDNPDQRISEDLNQFTSYVLTLSLGLLSAVVSLASFLVILWGLSGPANIPLGSWGTLHVPAYLVWAALLYAGVGTWLTIKIGRPLVPLNFDQQRLEANFRFSLVRWQIMKRQKRLSWFTSGYAQIAVIFPVVVVAPRYFAKQIGLGGLMQVVGAFSSVQNSLSFIISSYTSIAAWQAVTERLSGFAERLSAIQRSAHEPQELVVRREESGVALDGVDLDLPNGTPLLRGVAFASEPGGAVLISGPTGAGKSTLLRAIAGIWPYGRGEIRLAKGRILFVPQRPYLPLGTLTAALRYPGGESNNLPTADLEAVLTQVGLGALISELEAVHDWSQRLSPGEQQRLAFARILLTKPALLFLDEVTSALDERSEAELYGLLRTASWRPTIVSVGHRSTLRSFHDQVLEMDTFMESVPV